MQVTVLSAPDALRRKVVMLHAYEHAADAFTSTPQERAAEPDAWWVNRIAHAAARGGITVIQLDVTHGNEPATALHRSLGFQTFGVEPMAVLTPDGYRSKVHLRRQRGGAAA